MHFAISAFAFRPRRDRAGINAARLRDGRQGERRSQSSVHAVHRPVRRQAATISDVGALRNDLLRALTEPWGRPSHLAEFVTTAQRRRTLGRCVRRANAAWPGRPSPGTALRRSDWSTIAERPLLICLLESTPVCDIELERLFTALRFILLETATAASDPGLLDDAMSNSPARSPSNASSTSTCSPWRRGSSIRDNETAHRPDRRPVAGDPVPPLWLAVLAAYVPLSSLPATEAILHRPGRRTWTGC